MLRSASVRKHAKYAIVKFHYCRICGILKDGGPHGNCHYKRNMRSGFIVFYSARRGHVYVAPTYSSAGSISTYVDLDTRTFSCDLGWLWCGKASEFYTLAAEARDISLPSRVIMPEDYNYREIRELYDRYLIWYANK